MGGTLPCELLCASIASKPCTYLPLECCESFNQNCVFESKPSTPSFESHICTCTCLDELNSKNETDNTRLNKNYFIVSPWDRFAPIPRNGKNKSIKNRNSLGEYKRSGNKNSTRKKNYSNTGNKKKSKKCIFTIKPEKW